LDIEIEGRKHGDELLAGDKARIEGLLEVLVELGEGFGLF
jgi:hypothetical protein